MNIDRLAKIILGLLWLATLGVALAWIFIPDGLPFEPEPLTLVLGLISAAVTALVREFRERLIKEEYSTSYALAYGYVHNFLIPAIDKIEEQNPQQKAKIFIYMPEELKELEDEQTKRTLRAVRKLGFSDQVLNLELTKDRTRDLIVLSRSQYAPIYFDFPKTLLTLNSYIDYKLDSKANHFDQPDKVKLGKKYIDLFEQHMWEMLEEYNMHEAISVVNRNLDFAGLSGEQ
jgi:hypothetical protein